MEKNLKNSTVVTVLLAIFCNLLWGSAYPGIKLGYEAFGIVTVPQILLFAGLRFTIAGLILIIFTSVKNRKIQAPQKKNIPMLVVLALVYTSLQYFFFYLGLSNTTGTNGSIFNSTSTFLAVILAHFIYKNEKMTVSKVLGTVIGFLGVLAVTLSGGSAGVSFMGEGLIVIGALAFVVGSVISKKVTQTENPTIVSMYNLLIGGFVLIVVGLISGGKFESITWSGILGLLYLCCLSIGAYSIWTWLLTYNPVSKISIYNFIIPVSATILSSIFLNENIFEWKYMVSLVLVCVGIVVVNKPEKKAK